MTAGRGYDAPPLLRLLLGLVVLLSLTPTGQAGAASAAHARAAADDPLVVTLDRISPAVVPATGPVVLRGTVTNVSADTWTDVNVYPFLSPTPLTRTADLATAARGEPEEVPGGRIVELDRPRTFATLERLDPGESATYSVRVPHDLLESTLSGAAGVYWAGVQALGADAAGRDTLADGRAFTFLPLVGRRPTTTRVAVVVPLRRAIGYQRDGSLRGIPDWERDLGPEGRLSRLLAVGEAAPPGVLTWLIDPAVLDAARQLSRGDPPRNLSAEPEAGSPDPSPTPSEGEADDGAADSRVSDALRARADDWLARFLVVARRGSVLGLPYGDFDVAAGSQLDPRALRRATTLATSTFEDLGVTAQPTVAAPSGWLKPTSVAAIDPSTTILAADLVAAAALPPARSRPVSVEVGTRTVDLYDAAASSGGPGPTDPTAVVALRQRLLAEAALRSRRDDPGDLVVSLAAYWDPGARPAALLAGLGRPWLDLVPQPGVSTPAPPDVALDDLVYPAREAADELPLASFSAADRLRSAGEVLQNLLVGPTTISQQVTKQALTGLSYSDRARPGRTAGRNRSAADRVAEDLTRITISTPDFVTLSSTSGNRFRVDLVNGLNQAVRVRINPVVDTGLRIGDSGVITIEGDAKATVLLTARSGRLGFHQVDLQLTTPQGTRLGSSAELPVRASRTGRVIWVIIGAGAALLFGAIGMRLVRRFRGHRARRTQGQPDPRAGGVT